MYEMLVHHPALNGWRLKWSTSISYTSHEYIVGRRSAPLQLSRQAAIEVLNNFLLMSLKVKSHFWSDVFLPKIWQEEDLFQTFFSEVIENFTTFYFGAFCFLF